MQRTPVTSSLLKSIGYDIETKTLEVEFHPKKDGIPKVYQYSNVPPERAAAMLADKSVRSFFLARIKPDHECKKIEEPPVEKENKEAGSPKTEE